MLSKAIILATIAMLILIFLKVPVFVSMMSGAMVYFCMEPAATLQIAAQRLTSGMESASILAAPFFIFTGVMMNRCGVTERVMDFALLSRDDCTVAWHRPIFFFPRLWEA